MESKIDVTCNSKWTSDCCGKQNLDFPIINCDTRYYPDHSASCIIIFLYNFCYNDEDYVNSDIKPLELCKSGLLRGNSEMDIKQKVREWYNNNIIDAMEKALSILKNGLSMDYKIYSRFDSTITKT